MGKKKNDTITTEKCINEIIENALNRITDDIDNAFYSRDNNIIIAKLIEISFHFGITIGSLSDLIDLADKNDIHIPDEIHAAVENSSDKTDSDADEITQDMTNYTKFKPIYHDIEKIIKPLLESSFKNLSIIDLYTIDSEDIKNHFCNNLTLDIKNDIQEAFINAYKNVNSKCSYNVIIFFENIVEKYIDTLHNKIYQFLHDERIPISKAQLDMLPDIKPLPIILDILKYEVNLYESDPRIRKNNLYHLMEKYYKDTLEMYLYAIMLDIETNAIIDKFMYRSTKNNNAKAFKKLYNLLKAILPEFQINNISLDSLTIEESSSENDKSIIFNMRDVISSLKCKDKFKDYKSDDLILYSFLPAIITIFLLRYIVYDEYNLEVNNMPKIKHADTYNLYKYSENNTTSSDILTYIGLDDCNIKKINNNLLQNLKATNAHDKIIYENFPDSKIDVDIDDGYYTIAYIIGNLIEMYSNIYRTQKELRYTHEIYSISDLFCFVLSKTNEVYPKQDNFLVAFYKLMATVILRHFSNFAFKKELPWNLSERERDYIEKDFIAKGKKSFKKFEHENPYELFILYLINYDNEYDIESSDQEDLYNDITGNILSDSISTEIFNDSYKISDRYYILDSYKNYTYINPIDYNHFSDPEGKYNEYKQKFLSNFSQFIKNKENVRFDEECGVQNVNLDKIDLIFTKEHNKRIRSVLLNLLELNKYECDHNIWLHPDDRDSDF